MIQAQKLLSTHTMSPTKIPYFYSYSHILGCVLAMFGLMLDYLIEPASLPWYLTAFIFYVIGSLSFKNKPDLALKPPVLQISPKKVSLDKEMNHLILNHKVLLPSDALDLLISIGVSIESILPKLESNPYMQSEVLTVRKIVEEYLPVTLACYLKIPAKYAENEPAQEKTAHQLLIEQLSVLNRYLKEIFKNLVDEDVKALIINGRFLREKFTPPEDGFNI